MLLAEDCSGHIARDDLTSTKRQAPAGGPATYFRMSAHAGSKYLVASIIHMNSASEISTTFTR